MQGMHALSRTHLCQEVDGFACRLCFLARVAGDEEASGVVGEGRLGILHMLPDQCQIVIMSHTTQAYATQGRLPFSAIV